MKKYILALNIFLLILLFTQSQNKTYTQIGMMAPVNQKVLH